MLPDDSGRARRPNEVRNRANARDGKAEPAVQQLINYSDARLGGPANSMLHRVDLGGKQRQWGPYSPEENKRPRRSAPGPLA